VPCLGAWDKYLRGVCCQEIWRADYTKALRDGKSYRIARDMRRFSLAVEYHARQNHLEKFVKDTIKFHSATKKEQIFLSVFH